jgi:hypothetical protein
LPRSRCGPKGNEANGHSKKNGAAILKNVFASPAAAQSASIQASGGFSALIFVVHAKKERRQMACAKEKRKT